MIFVWGSRDRLVEVGRTDAYRCGACSTEQPFHLVCSYRMHHVWYLIRWIGRRDYVVQCPACGAAYAAPEDEAASAAPRTRLPWFDRFGWTVALGVVAFLVVLVSLGAANQASLERELLAHPRVNDLYNVNAARLIANPERSSMYTVMRVTSVGPGLVRLQHAKTYFEEPRGANQDLFGRMDQQSDYFFDETLEVPLATLQRLQDEGQLLSVTRR